MKENGYMTIYLALTLGVMISLCLALIEGCRYRGICLETECVMDIGMDSILAEYHRELFDQYNFFAVDCSYGTEHGTTKLTEEHLLEYMNHNFSLEDIFLDKFLYRDFFALEAEKAEMTKAAFVTDGDGEVFRRMAVDAIEDDVGIGLLQQIKEWVKTIKSRGLLERSVEEEKQTVDAQIREYDGTLPMLQRTCVRGSMTVEAALVLPLFCFFVISMGNAIEIIRLHGNLEVALWNAGRQISVYGALPEGQQGSADHRLEAVAVSYTYVKEQIEEQLGEEYLEMSPLDGGSDGLQFLESDIEGDIYTINMTYRIAGISQLSGFKKFRMANRYYGHMWNGYEIPEAEDEEYIYVTENGRVYHTNRECTHIRLSVRVVEATEALREYRPCEKCTDKIPHPTGGLLFFVSENGECYHSRRDCPGLKRTVQKIPKEEAFKYEVCSRCRGNNSKDR